MRSFALVFFVSFVGLLSVRAFPLTVLPRQRFIDIPDCTLTCAARVVPFAALCVQTFADCLPVSCSASDVTRAATFINRYCAGQGIVDIIDGVTAIPPVATPATTPIETQPASPSTATVTVTQSVTLVQTSTEPISQSSTTPIDPSTTFVSASSASPSATVIPTTLTNPLSTPAAISVFVVLAVLFVVGVAFYIRYWRRKRQGDFITTTRRSRRGKSFLIDGQPFRNRYIPDPYELEDKSKPASGSGPFGIKLKDRPLPVVPIPTKDSTPSTSALPQLVTAVTHPPPRNYVALPGREPSPPTSLPPVDGRAPPGLEGSVVSQTFAAGIERARNVLEDTRGSSLVSLSSPSGSPIPSRSPSSSSTLNTSVYATAAGAPPAYSYLPVAPSPLRAQVGVNKVHSTIIEEPRTPDSTTIPSTSASAPSLPPLSFSRMHSTVSPAQLTRPTFASHVRNPRSAETMRQFTFPGRARQSLNDVELQITVSEVLRDDGPLAERERSETPSGSMHQGAGGSISSVKGRFQALVGGMRRERE
ncbi:hypothetical protein FRC10_002311 [Ceratobasidium sp. 414]|nr:hypothetical protein FRC10_002311 [Ceratobasidium sp. 414]